MTLDSLIKTPTLTRELSLELSGVGTFIQSEMGQSSGSSLFKEELAEFEKSSSRLKLFSFPMLYNDFEGWLLDTRGEEELKNFRRGLRLKFPYISTLDQMIVFFMPADKQPCALSCFFLSEVLTRIMDVHGQSKQLKERYQKVHDSFTACKTAQDDNLATALHIEITGMPEELFGVLSPSLGKSPVLNLYQRTYDKLQSQYSNLPAFVFLQRTMEKIFGVL